MGIGKEKGSNDWAATDIQASKQIKRYTFKISNIRFVS
jgi:hypothetical protein